MRRWYSRHASGAGFYNLVVGFSILKITNITSFSVFLYIEHMVTRGVADELAG